MASNNTEVIILRMQDLRVLIKLSRSKIYDMLNEKSGGHDPDFPKPIKLGPKAVGWYYQEVLDWLESRKRWSTDS